MDNQQKQYEETHQYQENNIFLQGDSMNKSRNLANYNKIIRVIKPSIKQQKMLFNHTDSVTIDIQRSKNKNANSNFVNLLQALDAGDLNRDDNEKNVDIQTFDQFKQAMNAFNFQINQQKLSQQKNLRKPRYISNKNSLKERQLQFDVENERNQNLGQFRKRGQSLNIKLAHRKSSDQFQYNEGNLGSGLGGSGFLGTIKESLHSRASTKRNAIESYHEGLDLAYQINQSPQKYGNQNSSNGQQIAQNKSMHKSSAHSVRSCRGFEQVNQYEILQKIGSGGFSIIHLCKDIATDVLYAMKEIKKTQMRKKLLRKNSALMADNYINNQIAILRKINYPYIIKLHQVIEDQSKHKIYMILDYCKGGFINQIINDQNNQYKKLTQSDCKRYYKQLVLAIDYIHNILKIAHRDIKPQNILLSDKDEIKLSDFGLGTQDIQFVKSKSGTLGYLPPEIINSNFSANNQKLTSQMADIWALGITLLVLLTGKIMQFGENQIEPFVNGLKDISVQCKDFILKCLKVNPQQRITAAQMLDHPWIQVKRLSEYNNQIIVTKQQQQNAIVALNQNIMTQITKMVLKKSN